MKNIDLEFGDILIEMNFQKEIVIDLAFDLTEKELGFMLSLVGNKNEKRRATVARYYFALNHTIAEIADYLKIAPAQIHRDITKYRKEVLGALKKDLRGNKKILGHMVKLMLEVENRINEMWKQYNGVEADLLIMRRFYNEERERLRTNPSVATQTNLAQLTDAMKVIQSAHTTKTTYLHLLKEETKMMLLIWEKFGLTGEDAMKLVLSGGIDVDVKVEEVKTFLSKVIYIIQQEVRDENSQQRVFNRMANEIKESHLDGKQLTEEDSDRELDS